MALLFYLFDRVEARFDSLRTDMRNDMASLRIALRGDLRMLESLAYEHHGRLTVLEERALVPNK